MISTSYNYFSGFVDIWHVVCNDKAHVGNHANNQTTHYPVGKASRL